MKKITNKVALWFGIFELIISMGPLVLLYIMLPQLYEAENGITFVMVSMVFLGVGVTIMGLLITRSIFKDLYKPW